MSNINWEGEDIDDISFFGEKEYSYDNLPEEVEEVIQADTVAMTKWPKISHDGEQFLIRVPKEIAKLMRMKKGERVEFHATIPPHTSDSEKKLEIYYPPKNAYGDDESDE